MDILSYNAIFGKNHFTCMREPSYAPGIPSDGLTDRDASSPKVPSFSPLYQQIKGLMLQSLKAGEWDPGEMIPSEFELAARFSVSQGTVRKAIDELAQENLLLRKQGKGTFVATHSEQKFQYRFLKLVPNSSHLTPSGPAQRTIIWCKKAQASSDIATALELPVGAPILQIRRVLSFASVPTILEDMCLPQGPFKGLSAKELQNHQGPTYALFESTYGVRMVKAQEKITAVHPNSEDAQILNINDNTPLLQVERVALTYQDKPMEIRRALYKTEHHHYRNDLN
jgi:GntR family transcriptional regulator